MLSIISGEENHVYDLADPCYRRSVCVSSNGLYKKWRKGQMSLRRFIGSFGVLIVLLVPALSLPSNWTLGILVAAVTIFGIANFRDKRSQD